MANTAMERRYGMMRQQLAEQEAQQSGANVEALRRRFASLGALGSGAAIKTEQKMADASARRLQQAYGQLDVSRLAEEQGIEEAEKQRQFASGEAEKQRLWGTGERTEGQKFQESLLGRQQEYATREREEGQKFLSGENLLQREYATREREAGQVFQSALVDKQLAAQLENLMKQITSQEALFNKEFDLNKEIAAYNMYGTKGSLYTPEAQRQEQSRQMVSNIRAGFSAARDPNTITRVGIKDFTTGVVEDIKKRFTPKFKFP